MHKEQIKFMIRQADPYDETGDATKGDRECSGSVVECSTRDREAAGSILTDVTAL